MRDGLHNMDQMRAAGTPPLRLSERGERDDPAGRRAVAAENLNASLNGRLSPGDPVWRLAAQAATSMHGPVLQPEQRERLMQSARRMGVQRFDAGLVVALVQERARRGVTLDANDPTLALLSGASDASRGKSGHAWLLWAAAAVLGAVLAAAMISALSV
jgi:hypothetical protein